MPRTATMYRLWFFTFAQAFNQGPKGNAYLGAYTLFTPLSRRLVLITNIPFVLRNNAVQRAAHHLPVRADDADDEGPHRHSAISRSRPASCCTRRKTSRSRPRSRC